VLQIQNLKEHLCRPNGHNRHTTDTPMQYDCMTLLYRFYTISTATGNFAVKSKG